jgi:hypothetical protein
MHPHATTVNIEFGQAHHELKWRRSVVVWLEDWRAGHVVCADLCGMRA